MDHYLLPDGSHWEPEFDPTPEPAPGKPSPTSELRSFDYELESSP